MSKLMTIREWFDKFAETDSNIIADRSKLMSFEEFNQAVGWRDKEIAKIMGIDITGMNTEYGIISQTSPATKSLEDRK